MISYWQNEATRSWEIAIILFEKKKYPESLFFGHLTLEKILKALVVQNTKKQPDFIHALPKLAQQTGLLLDKKQKEEFAIITSFNQAGRYDIEKNNFRKNCTLEYTKKQLKKIENYYLWLKKELSQKK